MIPVPPVTPVPPPNKSLKLFLLTFPKKLNLRNEVPPSYFFSHPKIDFSEKFNFKNDVPQFFFFHSKIVIKTTPQKNRREETRQTRKKNLCLPSKSRVRPRVNPGFNPSTSSEIVASQGGYHHRTTIPSPLKIF